MQNSKDSSIEFFLNEDIRKGIREIIKPIANIMYNEIYIYIWVICFYNVFLFFIVLANLFLIIKILNSQNKRFVENMV